MFELVVTENVAGRYECKKKGPSRTFGIGRTISEAVTNWTAATNAGMIGNRFLVSCPDGVTIMFEVALTELNGLETK